MSVLNANVTPGYLPPDGQMVTPAQLRQIAQPVVDIEGTINASSIADGSITNPKLATNAVATVNLQDGSVATAKIANQAVTETQLAAASVGTAELIANAVTAPKLGADLAGFMLPYAGSSTPAGWLSCDGQAVSRTTYANLFTAIGTTWGAGDGSTTFNVPQLNGRTLIHNGTGTVALTFTADNASGNLTVASQQSYFTGTIVQVSNSGGALPTGLVAATNYFCIRISDTVVKLASTLANAQAGTAVAMSNNGSGTNTVTLTLTARTLAAVLGEEGHCNVTAETAPHKHNVPSSQAIANGNVLQVGGGLWGYGALINTATDNGTGTGAAHNNMQPTAVVRYLIKI